MSFQHPDLDAPVMFIIGPAGHGKTTAREIVSELLAVPGGTCSEVIYSLLSHLAGCPEEALRALDKEKFRPTLIAFGDWLTRHRDVFPEDFKRDYLKDREDEIAKMEPVRGASALVRLLVTSGAQVVDGIRRKAELGEAASVLHWMGYKVAVAYVEDPRKPPHEGDNLDISPDDFPQIHRITNGGDLSDLKIEVGLWLRSLGWKPKSGPVRPLYDSSGVPVAALEQTAT